MSYLEREKPVVFVGQPTSDDVEWWKYMHDKAFIQVLDDVWIEGDYYSYLISASNSPEITFEASTTQINLTDCATLEWEVKHSDWILLDTDEVENVGTTEICPLVSTSYSLNVYWVGGMEQISISIEVE